MWYAVKPKVILKIRRNSSDTPKCLPIKHTLRSVAKQVMPQTDVHLCACIHLIPWPLNLSGLWTQFYSHDGAYDIVCLHVFMNAFIQKKIGQLDSILPPLCMTILIVTCRPNPNPNLPLLRPMCLHLLRSNSLQHRIYDFSFFFALWHTSLSAPYMQHLHLPHTLTYCSYDWLFLTL